MIDQPKVSVVMPIYNAEPFLRQALDSVVGQTLKDIEIVCVNDGSKDSSLSILEEYAAKDSRIKIIDGPNGGYGHAMNTGMASATGEYIGILEPDDYLISDMYETLYAKAKENSLDFVRSNYNRFTTDQNGVESLEEVKIASKPEYYDAVLNPQDNLDLFNIRMENWTGIYNADFVRSNNIKFNESPGAAFQDNGFWFQSYCWATRIALIDRPFYCYRVDNAASSINQPNKVFTMLDEYKWIQAWLEGQPALYEKFIGIFEYKKIHNCMFAYSRLAAEYQLPFLERYAKEYREAFQKRQVDETLFFPDELDTLNSIVADPKEYLDECRKRDTWEAGYQAAKSKGTLALFAFHAKNDGVGGALKRTLRHFTK